MTGNHTPVWRVDCKEQERRELSLTLFFERMT